MAKARMTPATAFLPVKLSKAGCWSRRLGAIGLAGLLALTLTAGSPPARPAAAPGPHGPSVASPLDQPLRLLADACMSYAGVKDYSCLLIKRELVNGQLQLDNVIQMRVRTDPFSVYLRWQEPQNLVGQEACYVVGRNDGKLRVKGAGALGLFGFVTLDPDDARIKAASRHSITEAGIGNLLKRFSTGWERERRLGLTQVRVADYDYNKRKCTRVETIHPRDAAAKFHYFRNVVYFDKESKLPIRVECYDWPQSPEAKGPLAEVCSYAHLKLNVDLDDEIFNH